MLLKLLLLLSIVGMSFRRSPLNPKLDFLLKSYNRQYNQYNKLKNYIEE